MTESRAALLAVDGGDSKTDVVVVDRAGRLLGAARLAGSSHLGLGRESAADALDRAIGRACAQAGIDPSRRPVAQTGVYCLAGADLPIDHRRIAGELAGHRWTVRNLVRNDTFAVLRAGTDLGWGVGVVCGTGMNCSGVGPDGRIVRFAALGELSGDLAAGGGWLGRRALGVAVRARDGRGPRTALERSIPAHFQMSSPAAVMEAIYVGRLDERELLSLPPLVFKAASAGDRVAQQMLDEVADEVVGMATATIRRLRVASRAVEVILGGGIFRSEDGSFVGRIGDGIRSVAPSASVKRLEAPPVLGAALMGLDELHATAPARARLRGALSHMRMNRVR